MKKLHLIYFSPGGTTKTTVNAIPNVEIIEYDMLKAENRNKKLCFSKSDTVILGIMTATKLFGLPQEISNCLKGDQTPLIGVVLLGNGYFANSLKLMQKEVGKRGFKMATGGAFIGQHTYSDKIAHGRPDAKDVTIQRGFGENIYKKFTLNRDSNLSTPLTTDWPSEGVASTAKCALVMGLPGSGCSLPASWCDKEILDTCVQCRSCEQICPTKAIKVTSNTMIKKWRK